MTAVALTHDSRLTGRSLSTPSDLTLPLKPADFLSRQERIRSAVRWWAGPELHEDLAREVADIRTTEREGFHVTTLWLPLSRNAGVGANVYVPDYEGVHPAILNPHGHWPRGRFEDTDLASVPARCANMAKRGYVALSYDMIGYGDSVGVDHRIEQDLPDLQAWGLSLFGLQMQVGLAFLDYLDNLQYVDSSRIGCTGASGGGSQTMALALVDDRISAVAPVNMISAHCQGWCTCENPPGLRYEFDNVDFATALAPKPLLLLSCTGDWTTNTPQVEFPHIQRAYSVLGAESLVTNVHVESGHNFNMESRQAVYRWFDRVFTVEMSEDDYLEIPIPTTKQELLSATPVEIRSEDNAVTLMVDAARRAEAELRSGDGAKLRIAVKTCLGLAEPPVAPMSLVTRHHDWGDSRVESHLLQGADGGSLVPVVILSPDETTNAPAIVAAEHAASQVLKRHAGQIRKLLGAGRPVVIVDAFGNGGWTGPLGPLAPTQTMAFATTYNRTQPAEQARDVYQAGRYATQRWRHDGHMWIGIGRLGVAALTAAALTEKPVRVLVDIFPEDCEPSGTSESPLWPGFLRAGGLEALLRLCDGAHVSICVPDDHRPEAEILEERFRFKDLEFGMAVSDAHWDE